MCDPLMGAVMLLLSEGLPFGSRNKGPPESPAQVRPAFDQRERQFLKCEVLLGK